MSGLTPGLAKQVGRSVLKSMLLCIISTPLGKRRLSSGLGMKCLVTSDLML